MTEIDVIVVRNFLIALLIGALVGIEREKTKVAEKEIAFGGLRTFILFAQAGAVGAWLSLHFNTPWIFVAALLAVSAAVITGYVLESRVKPGSLGLTTEIAAITVCLLGGAVMSGYPELAVALAILTSSVLTFKQPLHGIVAQIGTDDIYAGLKLLIATFIVLPLLPATPIDPWGAFNPYRLWLLVILISVLSLIGYVAVRWLGTARGTAITGIAGGLASSTAVSLSMARQSRSDSGAPAADAFVAGVLLSWAVMFIRVVLTIAIVYRALVPHVLIPFGTMAAASGVVGAVFYRRHRAASRPSQPAADVAIKNPFSLTAATQFGLLFAVVLLLVKLAETYAPATGIYMVSAVAGLTDVDAITLSMSDFARHGGEPATAAAAVTVAAVTNTLVKCGFVAALGSRPMRRRIIPATAAILALGLASLFLV
jgi:uncharacterized membrane protein (DUF4010 family)